MQNVGLVYNQLVTMVVVKMWYTKFVNNFYVVVQICITLIPLCRLRNNAQYLFFAFSLANSVLFANFVTVVKFTAVKF